MREFWENLLDLRLRKIIRRGRLSLGWPEGTKSSYGVGAPHIAATLTDPGLPRRLVLNPELALGEAYTDGTLLIDGDDLYGFMELLVGNQPDHRVPAWHRPELIVQHALRKIQQYNPMARSRSNVAHHYDLSGEMYGQFLDDDRQYSCGYFRHPDDSLEHAQAQKKAHIAAKLRLRPGQRVLDVGCGWGGLALSLAREHDVSVLGITLSQEQRAYAVGRASREGLQGRVAFQLADYREIEGQFDRIVSVGMFEHVGQPQYGTFFRKVRDLLAEDGIALVHTIGRAAPQAARVRGSASTSSPEAMSPRSPK